MKPTSDIIVRNTCSECRKEFDGYTGSQAYTVICPHCTTLFHAYDGVLEKKDKLGEIKHEMYLEIGSAGIINGKKYVVTGYTYKKEQHTIYHWHEYVLYNPVYGNAYLSMYNGHWMFLTELDSIPQIKGRIVSFGGTEYQLFARYLAKTVNAKGSFLFNLDTSEVPNVREFIHPPYLLSCEKGADSLQWYKGEYVEREEIQKAFSISKLPKKEGVGMIQPYLVKFKRETFNTILLIFASIWVVLQLYFMQTAKEESVFTQNFVINDSTNRKELASKSFELKHGTKNAEITINANIDNNWMYTAITLVNETTGDIYDLDLEAEYYHGYDSDGPWSEGASWVSKVVSQVPEGKYFMSIFPQKPDNMQSVHLSISVKRDVFIFSNGIIVFILLALFPIYYYYRQSNFEKDRWYNSDYSPYEDD